MTVRRLGGFLTVNGSVKKDNKTGKYYYIVDIGTDQLTGKRKQKKRRGFNSKKEAEVALSQLTIDIREDTYMLLIMLLWESL